MRIEHKILLDLLTERIEISDFDNLSSANWESVVFEADRHRIAPLIYKKIKLSNLEPGIPLNILKLLHKKYLANLYRNTILFHQLDELVTVLNQKNIPVTLLKGAHLAEFVYKDIALRPMSDLDVLVQEAHLSEAVNIAFELGYKFYGDSNPAQDKSDKNYIYDIMPNAKHFHILMHPATNTLLEIHCFITSEISPFTISVSELWLRTRTAELNGKSIFLLSAEDLLIHLCIHTAYDDMFGSGLGALYDIFMVIAYYQNDIKWHELDKISKKWGTNRTIVTVCYFIKNIMGLRIPEDLFEDFVIEEKIVNIANECIFKIKETNPLHTNYIQWRNHKGFRCKVKYIKKVLFPPREYMANRYLKPINSRYLFVSYLVRFVQALKGIFSTLKIALCDVRYDSHLEKNNNDWLMREWMTRS